MRKHITYFFCLLAALILVACGKSVEERWQEQYDLGQKYLQELDYEQALIAFTNAIEIAPNIADAYIGRGDTYMAMGKASDESPQAECYQNARTDYEFAVSAAGMDYELFVKLADVYKVQNDDEALRDLVSNNKEILDANGGYESWLTDNGLAENAAGDIYSTAEEDELFDIIQNLPFLNNEDFGFQTSAYFLSDAEREAVLRPLIPRFEQAIDNNPDRVLESFAWALSKIYYFLGDLDNCQYWRNVIYNFTGDRDDITEQHVETSEGDGYRRVTTFSEYGQIIRDEWYGNGYETLDTCEYDNLGRRIKHTHLNTSYSVGTDRIETEITYSSDGRISTQRDINSDNWDIGQVFSEVITEYSYNGNTVQERETVNNYSSRKWTVPPETYEELTINQYGDIIDRQSIPYNE